MKVRWQLWRKMGANEEEGTSDTPRRKQRWIFFLGLILLLTTGSYWLHTTYLVHPIAGTSMQDTLQDGDQVLINKRSTLTRYSVIGFSVSGEEGMFVKRIIGMPGDSLLVQGNRMTLSLESSTFSTTISFELTNEVAEDLRGLKNIPVDTYFVIGDHVSVSMDSRSFGLVEKKKVEGKAQYKVCPLTEICPIN